MSPQTRSYIIQVTLAIAVVLLLLRQCGNNPVIPDNSKHEKDSIDLHRIKIENELLILKSLAKTQSDTIYTDRHHYHEVRRDSLIPCETKLILCDTIIVHDSIHDNTQDLIIVKQDSVIKDLKITRGIDSATIVGLVRRVKRERNKKRLWQIISAAALGTNALH